jgi:two-component system, NarL family, response regulator DevR
MSAPDREIRVLLVDDSQLVRHGIRCVIERHSESPRIVVAGEAASIQETLEVSTTVRPDLVLLDLRLPDGFGFTACRELIRRQPGIRVLVLTSYMDDEYIYEAITAGAHGYLMKEIDPAGLISAIIRVAAGESIISPDLTARVLALVRANAQPDPARLFTSLSPQEKRVLELVVAGKTNKEIGDKIGLSDNTVKNYLGSVFEKLNVRSRAQAAALYTRVHTRATRPKLA